ncbi:MAG: hypothetical protein KatS3mg052_1009 [Candidatus Roseilinea sp.]|nr:MAG: hypothetical protein KatS3mg052_1009 [Candidatus Roseilinea sp.]
MPAAVRSCPLLVGQAFNAVVAQPPDTAALGLIAVLIVLSQIVRAVLQLGRNFSSEIIGQRIERDARDELYTSLIGKSMSFHDRQSIGDIMARATNGRARSQSADETPVSTWSWARQHFCSSR